MVTVTTVAKTVGTFTKTEYTFADGTTTSTSYVDHPNAPTTTTIPAGQPITYRSHHWNPGSASWARSRIVDDLDDLLIYVQIEVTNGTSGSTKASKNVGNTNATTVKTVGINGAGITANVRIQIKTLSGTMHQDGNDANKPDNTKATVGTDILSSGTYDANSTWTLDAKVNLDAIVVYVESSSNIDVFLPTSHIFQPKKWFSNGDEDPTTFTLNNIVSKVSIRISTGIYMNFLWDWTGTYIRVT